MVKRRTLLVGLGAAPAVYLAGCGSDGPDASACATQPLTDEHSCLVCGMTIVNFPGPKGQVCRRDQTMGMFCSTSDMFAWTLQPESKPATLRLYVHDMGVTDWENPSDDAYIDAHEAYYVIDHPKAGAMGPTLAAFGQRADAEAFAAEHDGRILRFDEVDFDVLSALAAQMHQMRGM